MYCILRSGEPSPSPSPQPSLSSLVQPSPQPSLASRGSSQATTRASWGPDPDTASLSSLPSYSQAMQAGPAAKKKIIPVQSDSSESCGPSPEPARPPAPRQLGHKVGNIKLN